MLRSYRNHITLIILTLILSATATLAQTTSFTYQGRLTDGGSPANGNYDLQFSLFSTEAGGGQIGDTKTIPNVVIADGIFTVPLDFGVNAFAGPPRYLAISTRLSGSGVFNPMMPRQAITSTPYAIRSLNSATADLAADSQQLGGADANQYVKSNDPRLSDARVPATGSSNYIQNSGTAQAAQFNISGNGTVNGLLQGNLINASTQYMLGGQRFAARIGTNGILLGPPNAPLVLGDGANVGVGTEVPTSDVGNSRVLAISGPAAVLTLKGNMPGANIFEWQSGSFLTFSGLNLHNGSSGTDPMTILTNNNVGIGITSPTARLHVNGKLKVNELGQAGTTQLCLNANNELSNCSSSTRYKTDFKPFTSGLSVVNRLQPLTFRWKADNSLDLGLGAEDVAAVEPLLAVRNAQGQVEGVKYDRLSAVFINAIKEQEAEIASLRQVNDELSARLRRIEETLKQQTRTRRRR